MRYRKLGSSDLDAGITLSADVLDAIDEALGDVPVKTPTLVPNVKTGVTHR